MLYCIYHLGIFNGRRFDYGVTKEFVEKVVQAYLKGNSEITFKGRDYSVGSSALQIYEAPPELGGQQEILKFFNQMSYMHEGEIAKYCRNVTTDFLRDREWGELKEEYFNIYVNDGDKKPIIVVLTKDEVEEFHPALSAGKTPIFVSGRSIQFKQPKTIKIFDISFEFRSKNRSDIKEKIKKWVNENNGGKWSIKVLEHFGKDVTDNFKIKPFSSERPNVTLPKTDEVMENIVKPKIFISHSSKDRNIVNQFVEKILRLGLEIERKDVFCTSIEGMGIRTGDDFRNKIKNTIFESQLVIILLSKFYKESEICLNEMGAAWVLNKKVIPIILPSLEYDKVGVLHVTDHIDRINTGSGLDNIVHTIRELLDLQLKDFRNLNKQRDEFLKIFETDPGNH